ncbi:hypothetical protein M3Y94_00938100 [Aphelenchoides besseyi]|nr:hypothetical protein M3Y94_00938100 [Aphelenchoides besseyi]
MLRAVNLSAGLVASRGMVSASSAPKQTLIGPAVRLLLHDYQIDVNSLKPTGPKGNLLKSDVLSHISQSKLSPKPQKPAAPAAPKSAAQKPGVVSQKRRRRREHEDLPLTDVHAENIRQIIDSKTNFLEIRDYLNKHEGKKLSINEFIVKASELACYRVPETNSFFMNTHIRQNRTVNVSSKEDQGGTFSIHDLGHYGSVDHFTSIISLPQSCILAIGQARKKLEPHNDGHRQVTTIKVTLSCDHRVVDGASFFDDAASKSSLSVSYVSPLPLFANRSRSPNAERARWPNCFGVFTSIKAATPTMRRPKPDTVITVAMPNARAANPTPPRSLVCVNSSGFIIGRACFHAALNPNPKPTDDIRAHAETEA